MEKRAWCALSCAGLLAVAGSGCAGMRGQKTSSSSDPGARQVQAAQQQSEKALDAARAAQKRASEQAQRAADAQQEVQKAQQRLAQAQESAKQEQAKARQFQDEASEATQRASKQAQQSQQAASEGLAQQSQRSMRGEQVLTGQVIQASDAQLVVTPQGGGDPMTFKVTPGTRIRIDGQQASATELQQGQDARVAYEVSGTEPTAVTVQALTGRDTPSGSRPPSQRSEDTNAPPSPSTPPADSPPQGSPQGSGRY